MSFPEKPHRRARESLTTVQKHNTPLAEATTSFLEAFKAYSAGWKIAASKGTGAAIPFFNRAIDLDPKFAGAYAVLGLMYGEGSESARAAENTSKAYELRERTSDDEKSFAAAYYDGGPGEISRRRNRPASCGSKLIPVRGFPTTFCQDLLIPHPADMRSGSRNRVRYLRSIPDVVFAYAIRASDYVALDQMEEAEKAIAMGTTRKTLEPSIHGATVRHRVPQGGRPRNGARSQFGQGGAGRRGPLLRSPIPDTYNRRGRCHAPRSR
jgi:hypothetical protein